MHRATLMASVLLASLIPIAAWAENPDDSLPRSSETRAGYDWWSLQPLGAGRSSDGLPPDGNPMDGANVNPIDAFIRDRLGDIELELSPRASRRVLIRRLTFDLIGLPPTPEEIEAFVGDSDPHAYAKIVDRLLSSPHYGERWARHWLDVVHFGESHGFEYNQPRPNSWRYRNWVIDALNRDMPYDEFTRLQIAGDVLLPGSAEGVVATGFLVAGPHNTTLPSNDKMRKTMRQDEMEDLIATVGQTFLGMTINCARCHDHKFDPITQADYYRVASALSGVQPGERSIPGRNFAENQRLIVKLKRRKESLSSKIVAVETAWRDRIVAERIIEARSSPPASPPAAYASWDFRRDLQDAQGRLNVSLRGGARRDDSGLRLDGKGAFAATSKLTKHIEEKTLEAWVRLSGLDQRGGAAISLQTVDGGQFDAIVYGEQESRRWMPGSDSFRRTRSLMAGEERDATSRTIHVAIVYRADGSIEAYRDGAAYGKGYLSAGLHKFPANRCEIIFGLRHAPASSSRLLLGTIERAKFYDRALRPAEIAASAGSDHVHVTRGEIVKRLSSDEKEAFDAKLLTLRSLDAEIEHLEKIPPKKAYAIVPKDPGVTKILLRGDVTKATEPVAPSGVPSLGRNAADFSLAPDAPEADRRKKLAAWITSPGNPLFARVIVNRLWHYHFGRGIVSTPNDFGFNGGRPSHPGLLDWLAREFRIGGGRWKHLHRIIVLSETYRQASMIRPEAQSRDAGNRYLWRMSPRRLEGEALRDAMLSVSGQLNPRMGGRGYRDLRHYSFKGSNFYDPIEVTGSERGRRTIYRFSPRGAKRTLLDTFDCPDPSAITPARAVTTTPLQALSLLNNQLVLRLADEFAVSIQAHHEDPADQIRKAFRLAFGRLPMDSESQLSLDFIREQGLAAFCRVLFNSNEFLYIN